MHDCRDIAKRTPAPGLVNQAMPSILVPALSGREPTRASPRGYRETIESVVGWQENMTLAQMLNRAEAAIELLDSNVTRAIYLAAYFGRAAYESQDVQGYFDDSLAADGYNRVLDALYFELVVIMARLYDDPHEPSKTANTASIPTVVSELSSDGILEALRERLLQRHDPGGARGIPDEAVEAFRMSTRADLESRLNDLQEILARCRGMKGHHLVRAIRDTRNEVFAHTSLARQSNVRLKYGQAEQLLDLTEPLVAGLQLGVRSCHVGFRHNREQAKEQAGAFWVRTVSKDTPESANKPSHHTA